jgi:hypothetical protein
MKGRKSFDSLLTDLHSEVLPDAAMPALSLQSDGVTELSSLQPDEAERLAACEQIISEGLTTFMAVGNALIEIRQGKLYRSSHRTFESYCRERFQIKRQRAYELMGAADVVNSLSEISDKDDSLPLPQRESHANALAELPVDVRRQIWQQVNQEALRGRQSVTAIRIRQVIDQQPISSTSLSENKAKTKTVESSQVARSLKKALGRANPDDIRIEIRGGWLVREGLQEVWRLLRGRPDWVIDENFIDSLSLVEAKQIGIIR